MRNRTRKLALVHETVRLLSRRELGLAGGGTEGILNYRTSYAVKGCENSGPLTGCTCPNPVM